MGGGDTERGSDNGQTLCISRHIFFKIQVFFFIQIIKFIVPHWPKSIVAHLNVPTYHINPLAVLPLTDDPSYPISVLNKLQFEPSSE